MKSIFTTLFAMSFLAFTYAQSIPNNEFETWSGGKPTSWDCSNISYMGMTVTTVTQETGNVHSGTTSCKMETKELLGNKVPGFVTLGVFNFSLSGSTVEGGIPFPHRPTKLKGYYRVQPGTGDQAFMGIGLSKMVSGVRDTIGQGLKLESNTFTAWTPFEVDIDWTSTDVPDSLNIIISSSDLSSGATMTTGSLIWIDSLYFEIGSTVDAHGNAVMPFSVSNCYPNPANDFSNINFVVPENSVYDFRIINLIGVEVYKTQINAHAGLNFFKFSTSDLPSGIYMVNINNGHNNNTKSLVVNR